MNSTTIETQTTTTITNSSNTAEEVPKQSGIKIVFDKISQPFTVVNNALTTSVTSATTQVVALGSSIPNLFNFSKSTANSTTDKRASLPITEIQNTKPIEEGGELNNLEPNTTELVILNQPKDSTSTTPRSRAETVLLAPVVKLGSLFNYVKAVPELVTQIPSNLVQLISTANVFPFSQKDGKALLLPSINYKSFLKRLEEPALKSLKTDIDGFISGFEEMCGEQWNPKNNPRNLDIASIEDEQSRFIHQFIDTFLESSVTQYFPKDNLEIISECVERYILENLFSRLFCPTDAFVNKDIEMYNRIQSLQFLTPENFDIPAKFINKPLWTQAQEELLNINSCKAPRSKLKKILGCCKLIFDGLRQSDKSPCVDDFVPIFIYVILKANPPGLHSNIDFISHFRHPSKMSSESGYYFVSFLTCVSFIENINATTITIDPVEFQQKLTGQQEEKSRDLDKELIRTRRTSVEESDWVWISKSTPQAIYLSEKDLLSSLSNQSILPSPVLSRKSNDDEKLCLVRERILSGISPSELTMDELTILVQDYKKLIQLENSKNVQ